MPTRTGEPTLPTHPGNPIGGTDLIRKARGDVNRRLRDVQRWLVGRVKHLPTQVVTVNVAPGAPAMNAKVYQYQVGVPELQALVDQLQRRIEDPDIARTVVNRTTAAYEQGTAAAVVNLTAVSPDDYTRTIISVLSSEPWNRRVALIGARVFEEMQGFQGEAGKELGRLLMRGVEDGRNPLRVAEDITERFSVARSRANRIARTEITGALRRARWDEVEDARINLGVQTRLMWLSALSPTTRAWHASRHARLYTTQEVREFYSRDGNAINCKCSQTPVAVDADGNPIIDRPIKRAQAARERFDAKRA